MSKHIKYNTRDLHTHFLFGSRSANNAEAGRGAMGVRRGRLRRAATTIVAAAEMWGTRGD